MEAVTNLGQFMAVLLASRLLVGLIVSTSALLEPVPMNGTPGAAVSGGNGRLGIGNDGRRWTDELAASTPDTRGP